MHVRFAIHCDDCQQRLYTADGLTYSHENAADCNGGEVTLPAVSVDDLRAIIHGPAIADLNDEAQDMLDEIQGKKTTKKSVKQTTKKRGKK